MVTKILNSIINMFRKTHEQKEIEKNKMVFANMLLSAKSVVEADNGRSK